MNQKAKKGTTLECLKHFKSEVLEPIGRRNRGVVRKLRKGLCDLIGIGEATGRAWFDRFNMPNGTNLIKFRFFLESIGYEITEWRGLTATERRLSALVALSIITVKDMTTATGTRPDTALRWALGRTHPTKDKVPLIEKLLIDKTDNVPNDEVMQRAMYAEGIKKLRLIAPEFSRLVAQPTVSESPAPAQEKVGEKIVVTPSSGREGTVDILAHLIAAALPLAEELLSEGSPEGRDKLRQLTRLPGSHSNGVFELSNVLNRLCSERARKEI
jgi:hypothetical protein